MQEIEMNTYEGECKYCGNIQPIMAMDQVDANEKISEDCACMGAELERRKAALMQNLENTIGKNAGESGFKQVGSPQEGIITEMALNVFHGTLQSAACKIGNSTINITSSAGKVKIKRTDTRKGEWEA